MLWSYLHFRMRHLATNFPPQRGGGRKDEESRSEGAMLAGPNREKRRECPPCLAGAQTHLGTCELGGGTLASQIATEG